jgi:hypothetical protein
MHTVSPSRGFITYYQGKSPALPKCNTMVNCDVAFVVESKLEKATKSGHKNISCNSILPVKLFKAHYTFTKPKATGITKTKTSKT